MLAVEPLRSLVFGRGCASRVSPCSPAGAAVVQTMREGVTRPHAAPSRISDLGGPRDIARRCFVEVVRCVGISMGQTLCPRIETMRDVGPPVDQRWCRVHTGREMPRVLFAGNIVIVPGCWMP
jgi:hypothetical protein